MKEAPRACCRGPKHQKALQPLPCPCRRYWYCSTEHQKLHWPQHKGFCKGVQRLREWQAKPLRQLLEAGEEERARLLPVAWGVEPELARVIAGSLCAGSSS